MADFTPKSSWWILNNCIIFHTFLKLYNSHILPNLSSTCLQFYLALHHKNVTHIIKKCSNVKPSHTTFLEFNSVYCNCFYLLQQCMQMKDSRIQQTKQKNIKARPPRNLHIVINKMTEHSVENYNILLKHVTSFYFLLFNLYCH